MRNFLKLLPLLLCASTFAYATKQTLKIDKLNCNYEKDKGMLNGNYISYYPNGKVKAKGQFVNNNRVGQWLVYDEQGNTVIDRNYTTSLDFTQKIPSALKCTYNTNNTYDMLKGSGIWLDKRFFKEIKATNNEALINNRAFTNYVLNICSQKQTEIYEDDRFVHLKKVNENIDLSNGKIIGFKIKENAVIDINRFVLDYRLLGINPIVQNSDGVSQELGWLFFPDLLKNINAQNNASLNDAISLLLNRQYSAETYKAITMSSLTNNAEQYTIPKQYANDYQDVSLIEKEHDVWLQFILAKTED
jgi:Gliding motility associated protein GldN